MADQGSLIARVVLLLSPFVILLIVKGNRLSASATGCLIGATLLLPEVVAFDPPLLPRLDKHSLTALSLLAAVMLNGRGLFARTRPLRGIGLLIPVMMLATIGTALTNGDSLVFGPKKITALTLYDALAMSIEDALTVGIPFVLGRALIRDERSLRALLMIVAAAALLYSLLILLEVRISPQLHKWVYGYRPSSFLQAMRGEGYRPMVFMSHGLTVAMFLVLSIASAVTLRRSRTRILRLGPGFASVYLYIVLVLCKSLASLVYATCVLPLIRFASPQAQLRFAALLAVLTLAYPVLRSTGAFPTETLVEWGHSLGGDERAHSLKFRFDNEDLLAKRALDRSLFGWGGYRRGRLFNGDGEDITTIDGYWIILLGQRGWIGAVTGLGLLAFPILAAWRRLGLVPSPSQRTLLAGLAVALAIATVDLLPNGLPNRLPYYWAGALLGSLEGFTALARQRPARPTRKQPRIGEGAGA